MSAGVHTRNDENGGSIKSEEEVGRVVGMTSVGTELGSESQNWTLNWAAIGPVEQPRRVAAIPSWQEGADDDYGCPTAVRGNRCASAFTFVNASPIAAWTERARPKILHGRLLS